MNVKDTCNPTTYFLVLIVLDEAAISLIRVGDSAMIWNRLKYIIYTKYMTLTAAKLGNIMHTAIE